MHVKLTNSMDNNRRASRSRRTNRNRSRNRSKTKNISRNRQWKISNYKMLMYQRYIRNLILHKLVKMLLLGSGNSRLLIGWEYSPRYRIRRGSIVGPYSRGLMLRPMSIFDCFVLLFSYFGNFDSYIFSLIYYFCIY